MIIFLMLNEIKNLAEVSGSAGVYRAKGNAELLAFCRRGVGLGLRFGCRFGRRLGLNLRALPRLATKADPDRKFLAFGGIVGRDHRVVGGQAPARAVLRGRQPVLGAKMALEHLHFLAAFKAGDRVGFDRCAHRNGRLQLCHRRFRRLSKRGKRSVDRLDQARQVCGCDRIVADMGGDNVGDMIQQCFVFHAGETFPIDGSGVPRR